MTKTIIIAEAGVNHNGDLNRAKDLIKAAAKAGADYVKFQTFIADKIVSKSAKKASYQSRNINDDDDSQYNMLKQLEIPESWYPELIDLCEKEGVKFLSTGFDSESIDFLDKIPVDLFKIPSGEITNKPYLKHIASKRKKTILSTGMADLKEIEDALSVLMSYGLNKSEITILHCNTEYPTPMEHVNLLAMLQIKETFKVKIGYSDHTLGIEVPIGAVALGAKVIEKHFTLDRNLPGPDHKASLEPEELKVMVNSIRNIELAISGNGIKEPSPSEKSNKSVVRKSLHTNKPLPKGYTIKEDDLIALRPGDGISPMNDTDLIGKKTAKNLNEFHKLSKADIL